MDYDTKLWEKYTDENELSQVNPSEFIYHTALALGAKNILEVGCNVGNNLKHFTNLFNISGFDMNEYAIAKCQKNFPNYDFKVGSILDIPYDDTTFDLVFTRTVLIHVPDSEMDQAINELMRVSKKWIINIEFFGEEEKMIDWKRGKDLLWLRNMSKRWSKKNVNIINDTDLPLQLDPCNVRFTLIEKIIN